MTYFSRPLYQHHIIGALQSGALSQSNYEQAFQQVQKVLSTLRSQGEAGHLSMLESPFWKQDLLQLEAVVNRYEKWRTILVIGTGGVSLGAQAIAALMQSWVLSELSGPLLYFLDSLDSAIFWEVIAKIDPIRTGIIVLSKSGETVETILQLMRCVEYWKDFLEPGEISQHILVVTESSQSTLGRLAQDLGALCFLYPAHILGRFSCLTVAGLLPAMIIGLNVQDLRRGAGYVLNQVFSDVQSAPAQGAALLWALCKEGISTHVMMSYGDIFGPFSNWYRHLLAESLGRSGKGLLPVCARAPLEEHGPLQLYLDGPVDKLLTFLYEQQTAREVINPKLWQHMPSLSVLSKTALCDLVQVERTVTVETLIQKGRPVRMISVSSLTELTLGALFMHCIIETLILAELFQVDPLAKGVIDHHKERIKNFLLNTKRDDKW